MTNASCLMSKEAQIPDAQEESSQSQYDLEERTARFGEAIIEYVKRIAISSITEPLVGQLIRAATSVGANYCEADDAGSKKEFRYRISICKRECRETKYWLRMLAAAVPDLKTEARTYWREAKELHLIFNAIYRKTRPSPKDA